MRSTLCSASIAFMLGSAASTIVDVALVLHVVSPQRHPHRDVDGAAEAIGGQNLALQIGDRFDRAVVENQIAVLEIARNIALEIVGDGAQIVHLAVFDRQGERRIGEQRDIELARGDRGDHRRAAVEAKRLQRVALAEMLGDAVLGKQDRRQVCRRGDPSDADLDRVGRAARLAVRKSPARQTACGEQLQVSHCVSRLRLHHDATIRRCYTANCRIAAPLLAQRWYSRTSSGFLDLSAKRTR